MNVLSFFPIHYTKHHKAIHITTHGVYCYCCCLVLFHDMFSNHRSHFRVLPLHRCKQGVAQKLSVVNHRFVCCSCIECSNDQFSVVVFPFHHSKHCQELKNTGCCPKSSVETHKGRTDGVCQNHEFKSLEKIFLL